MSKLKIISVVGARPNFMKIAPFIKAVEKFNRSSSDLTIEHLLIHTGQHYDDCMSKKFFRDLGIPEANKNLGVGSGSHAEQIGQTMIAFEKVLREYKPDWVVVVGDVNATLACSITAKKEWIKCCHIEAGLRSGDLKMPEEINRLVTDRLSDLLLTPDLIANENLIKEGVPISKIRFVGNIMIDTLEQNRHKAKLIKLDSILGNNFIMDKRIPQIRDEEFAMITLHRPTNVDDKKILCNLIKFILETIAKDLYVIWPIHPRTYKNINQFGLLSQIIKNKNIGLTHPLGYREMLRLNMGAKIMLTDSGGLQEECTVLGTPCLTLRHNTERPITLTQYGGASVLVGNNINHIKEEYKSALLRKRKSFRPKLWDGKTADRIVNELISFSIEEIRCK